MRNNIMSILGVTVLLAALTGASLFIRTIVPAAAQGDSSANEPARQRGRAVVELIRKKDTAGLTGRFTPQMAQVVSPAAIQQLLDQVVTAQTPIGERVSEVIRSEGGLPNYIGTFRWTTGKQMTVNIIFAGQNDDRIAGLLMKPIDAASTDPVPVKETNPDAGVLVAGRSVAALIAKPDAAALYRRFTPTMASSVPEAKMRELLQKLITKESPLGEVIEESVERDPKRHLATYNAVYHWKTERNLKMTIAFITGSGGKIAGFVVRESATGPLSPDPRAGYTLKSQLHLPFAPGDTWSVFWGGDTREQNYHVDYPDQRHAYDLLVLKDGLSHSGDGKAVTDYYAWGKPILAPAAGTVVEVVDKLPDNPPGKMDAVYVFGNHIVLDLGNKEYAVFAHLQKGSMAVKKGDVVTVGQKLALCGNSGNSSQPHLHFHVQDKPSLSGDAVGLPITFVHYKSNDQQVEHGSPVQLQRISAGATP